MGPLNGLKVLEFPAIGPVPFCAMLLADLGATVLRLDRDAGLGIERARRFQISHRGRKVLKLDLKKPQTLKLVEALIVRSDVLIEGFRPGVMERLELGPDAYLGKNPRLIYGRMTGWGQTGPLAASAGHDINYIALTGALDAIGRRDQPPMPPQNLVEDFGGGSLYLALGILSALWERQRSGHGQGAERISSTVRSLLRCVCLRGRSLARRWRDRGQVFLQLASKVGLDADDALQQKRKDWPSLRSSLAEAFSKKNPEEWRAAFDGTDCCVTIVNTVEDAFADPHLVARKSFIELDGVGQPAPAPRFSRSVPETPRAPNAQNTADEALSGWLDSETVETFKNSEAWRTN
jgi:crotonobetainyl-CoA:carnitine CoA-transferase CaiB-like acyl-CoA transferase